MSSQAKMKSLMDDWRNLFSHQKQVCHSSSCILAVLENSLVLFRAEVSSSAFPQVYTQLAEDDKIRYKNEMKSWEEHMVEIGREDLLRSVKKPKPAAKKSAKKAKTKSLKKAAGKTTRKTKKSSPAKTVQKKSTKT